MVARRQLDFLFRVVVADYGVLARDPSCLAKLAAFQTRPIDGHSPLLGGLALNGYLAAGVRTDHEVTNLPEAKRSSPRGCDCSFAKAR